MIHRDDRPPARAGRQGGIEEALGELCDAVGESADLVRPHAAVSGRDLPEPYRKLLNHHEHMTTTLAAHFGQSVALRVLDSKQGNAHYSREILLTLGERGPVVEFGLVRIDLSVLDESVRSEIIARRAPLGEILIRHDVLRRIEPRWFLRFDATCPLTRHFNRQTRSPVYGRIGTIYCNERAAIELLEVVSQ